MVRGDVDSPRYTAFSILCRLCRCICRGSDGVGVPNPLPPIGRWLNFNARETPAQPWRAWVRWPLARKWIRSRHPEDSLESRPAGVRHGRAGSTAGTAGQRGRPNCISNSPEITLARAAAEMAKALNTAFDRKAGLENESENGRRGH